MVNTLMRVVKEITEHNLPINHFQVLNFQKVL